MSESMPDLTDQDRNALASYDALAEHGWGERDEDRDEWREEEAGDDS